MLEQEVIENSVSQQENVQSGVDYIEALKEMKNNTVSKEVYEKLKSENKQLVSCLINGDSVAPQEEEVKPDINELRQKLFSKDSDMNNLDYVTNALNLRTAIIAEGGIDPFLPYGEKILPTDEDIATANRVADVLANCVKTADGDSDVFTNELQRVTIDSAPQRGKYAFPKGRV